MVSLVVSVQSLWLRGTRSGLASTKAEIIENVGDVRFFGTKDLSRRVSSGAGSVKGLQVEPCEASERV